jgi:hypothetical protein
MDKQNEPIPIINTTHSPKPDHTTLRLVLPDGTVRRMPLIRWDGKSRLPFPDSASQSGPRPEQPK